ncbi:hypothetical protein [Sphingopyxis sp. H115]|uniref:hypothetical protein n=1 Tax=Sphingopyxis sp. H115 TaxID=1759073 RepID=UPI000735E380|nr:hypothetical protein [Sphingopyxis sp. H115]KTE13728.1 hypothetical protein ATE71_09525 [Sphingopyxis sp. H115]
MNVRNIFLAMGAAALMQPPIAVEAHILTLPSCGGAAHRMIVPGDPADPDQRRDCAKACHAVTDRRSKSDGLKKRCC